jgi:peptide/nickel transport system ATP-binding protein
MTTRASAPARSGGHAAGSPGADDQAPILRVTGLSVRFPKRYGTVAVLDEIDLDVHSSECVAVVGESGCGKSLLGLAMLGLLPNGAVPTGSVEVCGHAIGSRRRRVANREARRVRGTEISMVYQDATTSLNPAMTVGAQLRQALAMTKGRRDVNQLLASVHLADPDRIARSYSFELSGGQRQRALIALALARNPKIVVADEPTSALDVTIQAHIIELLRDLQSREGFALILISHDLALVSQIATRVAVLYAGRVVEEGGVRDVLAAPQHPYTIGLLEASASLEEGRRKLAQIPGRVPRPEEFSDGCRFAPRCSWATEECASRPVLSPIGSSQAACFHPQNRDAE